MPGPTNKLTDTKIEKAIKVAKDRAGTSEAKPSLLGDGGGLYLQISKAGAASWLFRYMLNRKSVGLGAFRRSELVALTCNDVAYFDTGIELLIRRSKTDQEGVGRTVFIPYAKGSRCPVKALKAWLEIAGISEGPLFRAVNRHDKVVHGRALTPQSVALIVKASVRTMRGDAAAKLVAGHSLRAGYCTEAATAGLTPFQIREQTGHKSDSTLARYIRPVAKRKIPSLL